jgi:hypothetical protein
MAVTSIKARARRARGCRGSRRRSTPTDR